MAVEYTYKPRAKIWAIFSILAVLITMFTIAGFSLYFVFWENQEETIEDLRKEYINKYSSKSAKLGEKINLKQEKIEKMRNEVEELQEEHEKIENCLRANSHTWAVIDCSRNNNFYISK